MTKPKRKQHKKLEDFKDKPPKMALYMRVSTEEQAQEGFSLDAQDKRMRAYCTAQGYDIYRIYREEGESGRTTKRTKYREMMSEIELWDGILVMKMDRIHRNSRNFMAMMDNLQSKGRLFVSMHESLDTSSAMGRFVMDIIQRIAQLESEQIGERVFIGMTQKAETDEAGILGFNAPLGYGFEDGELIIVQDQVQYIRDMFDARIQGSNINQIVELLNKNKIKTKKSNKWTRWAVGAILSNPIYAGYLRWNGTISKGTHEAIIDVKTYNAAQKGRRNVQLIEET